MNGLVRTAVAVALLMLTACVGAGKMWSEQNGFVLDEDTHQPIEGAIVVARWVGTISALVDSQTTCYHVESTTTDAQGRYRIPSWTKLPGKVHHDTVYYNVYKAGYRYLREDRANGDRYMQRDMGDASERLAYLDRSAVFCPDAGESMRKLLPLYKAVYAEASRLAATNAEKLEALYHLKRIEVIEFGSDEAWRRFHERERELK